MKITVSCPEGMDVKLAPHRLVLEVENDEEILVLKELLRQLTKPPETNISAIAVPRSLQ